MIRQLTHEESSKISKHWSEQKPYNDGVDIQTKEVYNILYGKVLYAGRMGNEFTLLVQLNSNECIRYSGLLTCEVSDGDIVDEGTFLGYCKTLHFEYCSTIRNMSSFTLRTGTKTYYKHNPEPILEGYYIPECSYKYKVVTDTPKASLMSVDQLSELTSNRGDNIVEF